MTARKIGDVEYDFSGRTVLVTGAGRAQGRAHALGFAAAGADVVVCDVAGPVEEIPYAMASEAELDEVGAAVEELGVQCLRVQCDVADSAAVDAMVAAAIERFGKIDVLVNNAGVNSVAPIQEMSDAAWKAVLDVQLGGSFNCSRAVTPHMIERKSGRILITGSVESFIALPDNAHYVAAKHGMLGLGRALAVELGPHNITVNVVCPGGVDSGMADAMVSNEPAWVEYASSLTGAWNLLPPGGNVGPEEITHAMMWLASDAAAYVTGTALVVDGGFILT